jgi:hypothetical protein
MRYLHAPSKTFIYKSPLHLIQRDTEFVSNVYDFPTEVDKVSVWEAKME